MSKMKFVFPIILILTILLLVLLERPTPIKIGYVGSLTGKSNELGISGRNGLLIAVKEINDQGGILGRPVELVIKDDQSIPEVGLENAQAFYDEGVRLIIGHYTSNMMPAIEYNNKNLKMLYIAPTMSTHLLAGMDDYFFRITSISNNEAHIMYDVFSKNFDLDRIAVVYDQTNAQYTEEIFKEFKKVLEDNDRVVCYDHPYNESKNYAIIAAEIKNSNAEGVLLLTNSVDASSIIQQLSKINYQIPTVISGWTTTRDFAQRGGKTVEGVIGISANDATSQEPEYLAFLYKYQERYHQTPSFAAHLSYDAMKVLTTSIESSRSFDPQTIKEEIIEIGTFNGLQTDFSIDAYGDSNRPRFKLLIKDGDFEVVE